MADDTRVPIEVDTGDSERRLLDVADASEQAGRALDELDTKAKGMADAVVDVRIDEDAARRASNALDDIDRKGRNMGDGVGFGNSALRDLTGPLGDSVGPAGDLGDAFEGLGDIAAGLGSKLGLGADAARNLAGGIAGLGVIVAAGVGAWSLYRKSQEQAKEAAAELLEVQKALRDGKFDEAAEALGEQYKGTAAELTAMGYSYEDIIRTFQGSDSVIAGLRTRWEELDTIIQNNRGNYETLDAAFAELTGIERLIGNLEAAQTGWATNEANILGTSTAAAGFREALVAIGEQAGTTAAQVDSIVEAFDELGRKLDAADAIENVRDAFDDVEDAALDAWEAASLGADDADRKMRDYEQSTRDAIREVLGLGQEIDGLPASTIAEIVLLVEQGDLDAARAKVEELGRLAPVVTPALDTTLLDAQFQNWLRTRGPGSTSMVPTRPPGTSGAPNPNVNPLIRQEGAGTVINNYYPPAIDPYQLTQASVEYQRVQTGPVTP